METCNRLLMESLAVAEEIRGVALQGRFSAGSTGVLELTALLQEISREIRESVQQEIDSHRRSGKWG